MKEAGAEVVLQKIFGVAGDRVPDLARDHLARDHAMDVGVVAAAVVVADKDTAIDAAVVPIPRHQ